MAFMGLLPSFGSTLSRQGSIAYGLLMTAVGLGSIAGPLALAGWAARANERRLLVATAVLSGLTLVGLGATRGLAAALAVAVTVGASQSMFMVVLYKETQTLAGEAMRGRVASFTYFFTAGVMGIFNLGFGLLATVVPPQAVMVVSGLAFIATTAWLLARVPALRWTPPAVAAPAPAGTLTRAGR
jgi:MFS family permease